MKRSRLFLFFSFCWAIFFFLFGLNFNNGRATSIFLQNTKTWSSDPSSLKLAEAYYPSLKVDLLPHLKQKIDEDKTKNIKSFFRSSFFEYFSLEKQRAFFWINNDQIRHRSTNKVVKWWDKTDRHYGNYLAINDEQKRKTILALTRIKEELKSSGWLKENNYQESWNYYKKELCSFHELKKITDGDTMEFNGLIGVPLLEKAGKKALKESVRILVLDTDETFWARYIRSNKEEHLPTRLGYVQKAVAEIVFEHYGSQKWCVVPFNVDNNSRTLALVFTPDGIPWHKLLIDYYGAGIYESPAQTSELRNRENYLMIQWWINDYWKSKAPSILTPEEKNFFLTKTNTVLNSNNSNRKEDKDEKTDPNAIRGSDDINGQKTNWYNSYPFYIVILLILFSGSVLIILFKKKFFSKNKFR